MTKNEINQLFNRLDDWRLLPDYQLERRVDIYFSLYLPQILERYLEGQPILKIIPEFPIKNFKTQTNHSFKIDYLVITATKVLVVELKTENSSRNPTQDKNLKKAIQLTTGQLIAGILDIYRTTKSKTKYSQLLRQLSDEKIKWVSEGENNQWINNHNELRSEQVIPMKLVYIQPSKRTKDVSLTIIDFAEVAEIVQRNKTALSTRFAQSLRRWEKSANKK